MGQIYGGANTTPVWLRHSQIDIQSIEGDLPVVQWLSDFAATSNIEDQHYRNQRLAALIRGEDGQGRLTETLASLLGRFISRTPWFSRLWVVQEIGLSRHAVFVWEHISFGCSDLLQALVRAPDSLPARDDTATRIFGFITIITDVYLGARRTASPLDTGFRIWFTQVIQLLASKPHDKAFALYGLLKEAGVELCKPNYDTPLDEVYWHYTVQITKTSTSGGAVLLEGLTGIRQVSSMASWVGDWSTIRGPRRIRKILIPNRRYQYSIRLRENDQHLLVKGVRTELIAQRADLSFVDFFYDPNDVAQATSISCKQITDDVWRQKIETSREIRSALTVMWNLTVFRNCMEFARSSSSSSEPSSNVVRELFELLDVGSSDPASLASFERLIGMVEGQCVPHSTIDVVHAEAGLARDMKVMESEEEHMEWVRKPEYHIMRSLLTDASVYYTWMTIIASLLHQTLIRTASGRLGFATYTVAVGDSVFRFQGSEAPAIIRSHGEHYHWITSWAYITGAMDHDIYPEDDDRIDWYTFV